MVSDYPDMSAVIPGARVGFLVTSIVHACEKWEAAAKP